MILIQVRTSNDQLVRTFFILNHNEEVLDKDHDLDIGGLDSFHMDQALLLIFGVLENVNSIFHCDSEELNIFLECGCNDIAFFEFFRYFEAFDLLQVVRLDHFLGGDVDLAHSEVLEDAHDLRVQEEEVNELGPRVLEGHRQEVLLQPFSVQGHALLLGLAHQLRVLEVTLRLDAWSRVQSID